MTTKNGMYGSLHYSYTVLKNEDDTTRVLIGYTNVLDESILNIVACITSPAFSPANYLTNEIYNAFPCNIAISKHLDSWENSRVVLGNHLAAPCVAQRYSRPPNFLTV